MALWTTTDNNAGKPKFDAGADVFGIDATEIGVDTSDNVVALTLVGGGTGYANSGNIVFAGGTPSTAATGTFTASGGIIQTVTLTGIGVGYDSVPTADGNSGGNGDASITVSLGEGSQNVAHTGWNKRTVGTGGRAGRVFWETLVAGGMSGDAEDIVAPDA